MSERLIIASAACFLAFLMPVSPASALTVTADADGTVRIADRVGLDDQVSIHYEGLDPATDLTRRPDSVLASTIVISLPARPEVIQQGRCTYSGGTRLDCPRGTQIALDLGAGDDVVQSGVGSYLGDTGFVAINGGPGSDTVDFGKSSTPVTVNGPSLTGWKTSSVETIVGSDHDDSLSGTEANETILAGRGSDRLDGSTGSDVLDGGEGRDSVDYSDRSAPVSVSLDGVANDGEAGEQDDVRASIEQVTGGAGDDHLVGEDGTIASLAPSPEAADRLYGGPGNDTLEGLGGEDTLNGGPGNDRLLGGPHVDNIFGGSGDDLVDGGQSDDVLRGDAGNDTIYGRNGEDLLFGGTGRDRLVGGAKADLLGAVDDERDTLSCDALDSAAVDPLDRASSCKRRVVGHPPKAARASASAAARGVERSGTQRADTIRGSAGDDTIRG
ncbi:MAG TPA: calcium-binding protein, partial [Baekduia sp.]|nr:calcium-binding protein [Baekduia sp.]